MKEICKHWTCCKRLRKTETKPLLWSHGFLFRYEKINLRVTLPVGVFYTKNVFQCHYDYNDILTSVSPNVPFLPAQFLPNHSSLALFC